MKKINSGKLRLQLVDVIERSQPTMIYGGSGGDCNSFVCSCGDGVDFMVTTDGDHYTNASYASGCASGCRTNCN